MPIGSAGLGVAGFGTAPLGSGGLVLQYGSGYVGPLDLVPEAVVAYGVRALSAAMLGQNIFRLRRDSDDAEMDFAADASTGDAPAASIATWLGGANGFLVTLYDQSGNGKNATQATAANQPQWLANQTNGKCGIQFVKEDLEALVTAGTISYTDTMTSIIVGKYSDDNKGDFCGVNEASGVDWFFVGDASPAGGTQSGHLGIGSYSTDTFADYIETYTDAAVHETLKSFFVAGLTLTAAGGTVRLNGTLQAVTTDVQGTFAPYTGVVTIGASGSGGGSHLGGIWEETILYGSVVSAANILSVNQNQGTYYGITLA